ncbi:hypothetical protein X975_07375, partial [Stegodyphus mimosarum]
MHKFGGIVTLRNKHKWRDSNRRTWIYYTKCKSLLVNGVKVQKKGNQL